MLLRINNKNINVQVETSKSLKRVVLFDGMKKVHTTKYYDNSISMTKELNQYLRTL